MVETQERVLTRAERAALARKIRDGVRLTPDERLARYYDMKADADDGVSDENIGRKWDLTQQRVWAILSSPPPLGRWHPLRRAERDLVALSVRLEGDPGNVELLVASVELERRVSALRADLVTRARAAMAAGAEDAYFG